MTLSVIVYVILNEFKILNDLALTALWPIGILAMNAENVLFFTNASILSFIIDSSRGFVKNILILQKAKIDAL